MAYVLIKKQLKNNDFSYNISTACRVSGTINKQKRVTVKSFRASDLIAKGINPDEYASEYLEKLKEEAKAVARTENYVVDFSKPLTLSTFGALNADDSNKNLGFSVYSKLYHKLELDELVNNRRRYLDCEFNINVIFQHLLYSRLLWPASKKNTWEHKERFFGDTDYEIQHVYRSMDALLKWRTDILKHLDSKIKQKYGRRDTVVFYDVTNYYFEIDNEDDEDGLRADGVGKEHRPLPIIQMGLFMDEMSLPITYELFRGNTNDSVTLPQAMDNSIIDFADSRKIVVADKGMMSYYNILKIREARNGYVISQSIRKSDEQTKAFALSPEGWSIKTDENGQIISKIKERTIPRTAKSYGDVDNKKHSGIYNERQVFIWSKKYADRAKYDRQDALKKAMDYVGHKSKDYKDSIYGKNKYLKKKPVIDGKQVDPDSCIYEFDYEQLKEDEMYDGYYIICTNVIGVDDQSKILKDKSESFAYYRNQDGFLVLNHVVPASEIADIYGGLWKIEETFKVTKTGMLNLRPVFHSKQDRIRAHFMICFIALVLERLLEKQLGWKYSAKTIQESLSSFSAVQLDNSNIYQVSYYDAVIDEILKTLDIPIQKKFMTQNEIRTLIGQTKKKDYES